MPAELLAESGPAAPAVARRLSRRSVRHLGAVVALAAGYYGAAKLGYALRFSGPVAAILWLPVGVGISALYLGGLWLWPGVVLGDLLANDYSTLPLGSALGQTAGNLLEVLVATLLLRRLLRGASPLESVGGLGRMLVALAAATALSATIGVVSLALGDVIGARAAPGIWRTWWLGDFTGALVVVPLAIAWHPLSLHGLWAGRPIEGTAVLVAVAVLTSIAFSSDAPLTYLAFPALIWAALRLGGRAATLAIAVAVSMTVFDTAHFEGPFAFHSITQSVLATQLYISVAALSTLSLAAVVSERERYAAGLAASRLRLVHAGDTARRHLERDLHDGAQQRLTALAVNLGLAADEARRDPAGAPDALDGAASDLLFAIDELRQLARGLHPGVLDLGLAQAVHGVADRSALPIAIAELPRERASDTAEATAYFVVAEAVTNAQRHARATSVRVRVALARGTLRVEVSDDGVGGADESAGSGLQGLRDRVEAIGGTFTVESPRGLGTRVVARIPA